MVSGSWGCCLLLVLVLLVVEVHRFKHKNGFGVVGLPLTTSISPSSSRKYTGLNTKMVSGSWGCCLLPVLVLLVVEVHRFKHKNGFGVVGLLLITSTSPTNGSASTRR
jgi:hypothetical protein